MRRFWLTSIALVAVLIAAFASGGLPLLRATLGRTLAMGGEFGSRTTIRLLSRIDALNLAVPADADWTLPRVNRHGSKRGSERSCGDLRFAPGPAEPELTPSTKLARQAALVGAAPVLSIAVESCRLRRLLENPSEHGREWEEPAFVSYFEQGELRFSSGVGLRIHGGRRRSSFRKSWRLHFRTLYGEDRFAPEVVTDAGATGPRQVVLKNGSFRGARGDRWYLHEALAFEIVERLGGIAPRTQGVRLLLNGEPYGVYLLTERLDEDLLARRFGDEPFDLVRLSGTRGLRQDRLFKAERRWVLGENPMTARKAERRYDLDNLTSWFAAVAFCGTGDAFQTSLARPRGRRGARWFWIAWDMDLSFVVPVRKPEFGWQKDLIRPVIRGPAGQDIVSRILIHRLLTEDEGYRRHFVEFLVEALNHRLDEAYLKERLVAYRQQVEELGAEETGFFVQLEEFLERRPGVVREQLARHLGAGREVRLEVRSPRARQVVVDGYAVGRVYRGKYFSGMTVEVSRPEDQAETSSWWEVDGQRREGRRLELELTADTVVDLVIDPRTATS